MTEDSSKYPRKIRGELWVLGAAVLWGTTGTAQAFAPGSAAPAAIGAFRLLLGSLVLLTVAVVRRSIIPGRAWVNKGILLAAVCIAAYQLCFFAGVRITGVAVGTMVAIGIAPVLAGMISRIWEREKLSRRWKIATSLTIAGCVLLFSGQAALVYRPLGIFLAMGAGLAYAVYAIITKHLIAEDPPEAVIAVVFSFSALLLLPVLFLSDLSWLLDRNGIAVVLHLGIIATGFAYLAFAHGLQSITAPTAVTLSLAEPLTAAILGIAVLQEQVNSLTLGGMALLFSGLIILTINRSTIDQ